MCLVNRLLTFSWVEAPTGNSILSFLYNIPLPPYQHASAISKLFSFLWNFEWENIGRIPFGLKLDIFIVHTANKLKKPLHFNRQNGVLRRKSNQLEQGSLFLYKTFNTKSKNYRLGRIYFQEDIELTIKVPQYFESYYWRRDLFLDYYHLMTFYSMMYG